MRKIQFGKTGMKISSIGFGGIPVQRLTEEKAVSLIIDSVKLGINWIDTANGYGTSEERVGKALKDSGIKGNLPHIFTKAGGRTPEELENQVEESFSRLCVEYIDLYQFHIVPSPEKWQEMRQNGCLDLLKKYRDEGRIGHIGASAHKRPAVESLIKDPDIESIQWPFNFMLGKDGTDILEKCVQAEKGFIAMKPFGGGVLEDASLCIGYMNVFEHVAADPGFESIDEVREVIAVAESGRRPDKTDLARMKQLRDELGKSFCRRCGYCQPCPEGVSIVPLMTMESLIKRFAPDSVINGFAGEAAATADRCTECGDCLQKCPYELAITTQIKKGKAAFDRLVSENDS